MLTIFEQNAKQNPCFFNKNGNNADCGYVLVNTPGLYTIITQYRLI